MSVVVVAGATGFVGKHVVARLQRDGHQVVGGTRNPAKARKKSPEVDWVRLDVEDSESMQTALQGADALVYLVHQMAGHGDDLMASETESANRVLSAAQASGVKRIVYLGGPDVVGSASPHLAARLQTGRVLRSGSVSTIELQAAMIIGAGSESWLMVRDLALRLPLMIVPKWLDCKSQPLGIEDVVNAVCRCVVLEEDGSVCLPLPGPEILSAKQILRRVGKVRQCRTFMIPVPVLTPSLSSHWIRLVSRADYGIARQLVDGLTCDLVAKGPTFWDRCPDLSPTPIDDVIASALAAEDLGQMPAWQRGWERAVGRLTRQGE